MSENRRRSRSRSAESSTVLPTQEVAPCEMPTPEQVSPAVSTKGRSRRARTENSVPAQQPPFVIDVPDPITDYNETVPLSTYIGTVPSFAQQEIEKQDEARKKQIESFDTSLPSIDALFGTQTMPYGQAFPPQTPPMPDAMPVVPFPVSTSDQPDLPDNHPLTQWAGDPYASPEPAPFSAPYQQSVQAPKPQHPTAPYSDAPTNKYEPSSKAPVQNPAPQPAMPSGYAPHPDLHQSASFNQLNWVGLVLKLIIIVGFIIIAFWIYQVLSIIQNNQNQQSTFSGNPITSQMGTSVELLPPGQTYAPTQEPIVIQTPTPTPIIQLAS